MTVREMMTLHADVMSLQGSLGISYKDASHWLYMNKFEKLKIDDKTVKAFSCMTKRLWDSLTHFQKRLETQSPGSDANADADTDAEVIDSTIAPWNMYQYYLASFLSILLKLFVLLYMWYSNHSQNTPHYGSR